MLKLIQPNGRRESTNSPVAQLAPSSVTDANQQRLNNHGIFSGEAMAALSNCIDTKRLELAIVGSGARIKVSAFVLQLYFQAL